MLGRVPQKQHTDRTIVCLREHQAQQKQNRDKESGFHFEWNKFRWRVVVGQHVKGGAGRASSILFRVRLPSRLKGLCANLSIEDYQAVAQGHGFSRLDLDCPGRRGGL